MSDDGWTTGPTETPKPKHRARRKSSILNPAKGLLDAVRFIKPAQKKKGSIGEQHCIINAGWIVASNDVLTIGTPIKEEFCAYPHTYSLEEALKQVGEDLSISTPDEGMSIVSGDFKAVIETTEAEQLPITGPDANSAPLDDRVKDAMKVLAPIPDESSEKVTKASVMLQTGSAVATNGYTLVEYWHGCNLPPNVLIPKQAANAIAKTKKTLVGFGYSGPSATFWFEDGSFIKTQLFNEPYPDYAKLLECEDCKPWDVPKEFFKAVKTIEKFSEEGFVLFEGGKVVSHEVEVEASTYKLDGLPERMSFTAKNLTVVEKVFKTVYFTKVLGDEGKEFSRAFFFGENVRGAVSGISWTKYEDKGSTQR